eukprot:Gregarina_sp_Poly_1__1830@NODE_1476_length_4042_cov_870_011321_g979_i0_p2_GENE_NODE_1476_length_4042_cov_870_011321_g979_i0NODE_1476_length_4042_cov_870_011321_g979_i0_p2_ORF_typecomplete_len378_score34_81_NODE_1476_length_4042_cov_870_011321_g979_i028533986
MKIQALIFSLLSFGSHASYLTCPKPIGDTTPSPERLTSEQRILMVAGGYVSPTGRTEMRLSNPIGADEVVEWTTDLKGATITSYKTDYADAHLTIAEYPDVTLLNTSVSAIITKADSSQVFSHPLIILSEQDMEINPVKASERNYVGPRGPDPNAQYWRRRAGSKILEPYVNRFSTRYDMPSWNKTDDPACPQFPTFPTKYPNTGSDVQVPGPAYFSSELYHNGYPLDYENWKDDMGYPLYPYFDDPIYFNPAEQDEELVTLFWSPFSGSQVYRAIRMDLWNCDICMCDAHWRANYYWPQNKCWDKLNGPVYVDRVLKVAYAIRSFTLDRLMEEICWWLDVNEFVYPNFPLAAICYAWWGEPPTCDPLLEQCDPNEP